MEGILIKSALWTASLGTVVTAALFVSFMRADEPEPVEDVAAVRHASVEGAPNATGVAGAADARTMVASYYHGSLAGNPTANGGVYRPERYTAAHRTLPLGTELRISYGGRSVEVIINDRGPYVPGHDLDLSFAAAEAIGLIEPGTAPVRVAVL